MSARRTIARTASGGRGTSVTAAGTPETERVAQVEDRLRQRRDRRPHPSLRDRPRVQLAADHGDDLHHALAQRKRSALPFLIGWIVRAARCDRLLCTACSGSSDGALAAAARHRCRMDRDRGGPRADRPHRLHPSACASQDHRDCDPQVAEVGRRAPHLQHGSRSRPASPSAATPGRPLMRCRATGEWGLGQQKRGQTRSRALHSFLIVTPYSAPSTTCSTTCNCTALWPVLASASRM